MPAWAFAPQDNLLLTLLHADGSSISAESSGCRKFWLLAFLDRLFWRISSASCSKASTHVIFLDGIAWQGPSRSKTASSASCTILPHGLCHSRSCNMSGSRISSWSYNQDHACALTEDHCSTCQDACARLEDMSTTLPRFKQIQTRCLLAIQIQLCSHCSIEQLIMRFISDMADGEPSARGRHGRDVGLVPAGKRLKEVVRWLPEATQSGPFCRRRQGRRRTGS